MAVTDNVDLWGLSRPPLHIKGYDGNADMVYVCHESGTVAPWIVSWMCSDYALNVE